MNKPGKDVVGKVYLMIAIFATQLIVVHSRRRHKVESQNTFLEVDKNSNRKIKVRNNLNFAES